MKIKLFVSVILAFICLSANAQLSRREQDLRAVRKPTLKLLLAKTNIPGSFVTSQCLTLDQRYVIMASFEGQIHLLDKTNASCPVVKTITCSTSPVTAVHSDGSRIRAASADGFIYVYKATVPYTLYGQYKHSEYGLNAMHVGSTNILAGRGQCSMTVSGQRLYVSQLNEGDVVTEIDKATMAPTGRVFGSLYEENVTVVYDLVTGDRLGSIPNPVSLINTHEYVNLAAAEGVILQTLPGPLGRGVEIIDSTTGQTLHSLQVPYANVATIVENLVVGTEAGTISVYQVCYPRGLRLASTADLRQLTGATYAVDSIEIRSIAMDPSTRKVYGVSTANYGNNAGKLFVLSTK